MLKLQPFKLCRSSYYSKRNMQNFRRVVVRHVSSGCKLPNQWVVDPINSVSPHYNQALAALHIADRDCASCIPYHEKTPWPSVLFKRMLSVVGYSSYRPSTLVDLSDYRPCNTLLNRRAFLLPSI